MSDRPIADALIRDLVRKGPDMPLEWWVDGVTKLSISMNCSYENANQIILTIINQKKR
jgi:hypothetical protein